LVGGIRPHLYCLPILKGEHHRAALLEAVTSTDPAVSSKFFAGTDSAPHVTSRKESSCGCAGVYTAHAALELYATAFDSVNALPQLTNFLTVNGAVHYGLPLLNEVATPQQQLVLEKFPWRVPPYYRLDGDSDVNNVDALHKTTLTPLRANETIVWSIVSER
jgi:dihydroorotase